MLVVSGEEATPDAPVPGSQKGKLCDACCYTLMIDYPTGAVMSQRGKLCDACCYSSLRRSVFSSA